ncbi:MAG: MBL fold metallo-hydrolase [Bacilli bacterium]|jgi:hydroxyacylglutathione hydrolase
MRVITKTYPISDFSSNLYILVFDDGSALIIDPGIDKKKYLDEIFANYAKVHAVLLTHGHFDHIRGAKPISDHYNCPIYVSSHDRRFLEEPEFFAPYLFGLKPQEERISEFIDISLLDSININGLDITIISTPFHTLGSTCFYIEKEKLLFSGDTLFKDSIGRTDLITSDPNLVSTSLKKLLVLPNDTLIYPGHGPSTSLEEEKENNPYLISL